MSSQKNIVSLFRIRKPLVKRVRHHKETTSSIRIAASISTPPASAKKDRTPRLKDSSTSESKPKVDLESPTPTTHLSTPPTKALFRRSEAESSRSEDTPQIESAASLQTSPYSRRPRFCEVLSSSVTPSGLDDTAILDNADVSYNHQLEYVSDDEDEDDDACEIRESRRVHPDDDPLLSHIIDNFTNPSD